MAILSSSAPSREHKSNGNQLLIPKIQAIGCWKVVYCLTSSGGRWEARDPTKTWGKKFNFFLPFNFNTTIFCVWDPGPGSTIVSDFAIISKFQTSFYQSLMLRTNVLRVP